MKRGDVVFLTGITGTVGSWLAGQALRDGLRVRALVRGTDIERARRQVRHALEVSGAGPAVQTVEIVLGDLCLSGLGLSDTARTLDGISMILHCAAFMSFDEASDALNHQTNVDGTAAVLELARRAGVGVAHVSTAYVAGRRSGLVRECEVDVGQSFNNPYERSKCQAEKLVGEWSRKTGLPAIILRPGIILGDSLTGRTIHFNTLYHLMRFFDSVASDPATPAIRIAAEAQATKNMIPIDYMAQAAWHIISRGLPGTYHLTNPAPMTIERIHGVFSELFNPLRLAVVSDEDFDPRGPTRTERLLKGAMRSYASYLREEPSFDRHDADAALAGAGLTVPPMDLAYFQRLLAYAHQTEWGARSNCDADILSASEESGTDQGQPHTDSLPSPRVDTIPAPPACFARYFGEFLATKTGRRLLPDLRSLTADFNIIPAESPGMHWSLEIREGVLMSISSNGGPPQCSFLLDSTTFKEIVSGVLEPQHAFFRRRVEIVGDIEVGLRVAAVLASFFRAFPWLGV